MIKLKESCWLPLYEHLAREYKNEPSVLIIREKMRRVLGCTVRRHREWVNPTAEVGARPDHARGHYQEWICLDFYDDRLETWFQLKYAEFLGQAQRR